MFVEHKEVGEEKKLDESGKLLLKVADVIERDGWCQGSYTTGKLSCIVGAIVKVEPDNTALRQLTYSILNANIGGCVIRWNDTPGRTQAEVVAKLRAVALGG